MTRTRMQEAGCCTGLQVHYFYNYFNIVHICSTRITCDVTISFYDISIEPSSDDQWQVLMFLPLHPVQLPIVAPDTGPGDRSCVAGSW